MDREVEKDEVKKDETPAVAAIQGLGPLVESPGRQESLILALQALSRYHAKAPERPAVGYDLIAALSGVCFVAATTPHHVYPGWWILGSRAQYLESAVKAMGLTLERIEVPTDSEDAAKAAYYEAITQEIEAGRPVLVNGGFPSIGWGLWGVVTRAEDGKLHGQTCWFNYQEQTVGDEFPIISAYRIDKGERAERTPVKEIITQAAQLTAGYGEEGWTTGPDAYDLWISHAEAGFAKADAEKAYTEKADAEKPEEEKPEEGNADEAAAQAELPGAELPGAELPGAEDFANNHRQMASFVHDARAGAGQFLDFFNDEVPAMLRRYLPDIVNYNRSIVSKFKSFVAAEKPVDVLGNEEGRQKFVAALKEVQELERKLATAYAEMAAEDWDRPPPQRKPKRAREPKKAEAAPPKKDAEKAAGSGKPKDTRTPEQIAKEELASKGWRKLSD